jgi:SAM-dependent methyltransferase
MDLKELNLVNPQVHWYYQSKWVALSRLIKSSPITVGSIIEVGAGSGFFGKQAKNLLNSAELTCVDINYSVDEEVIDAVTYLKYSGNRTADLYLFIDVLEHVQDDKKLVKEYLDSALPGSLFIVTVPAFMSLWSGHDEYLEHYKRYRVFELHDIGKDLDLRVLKSGYLFSIVFPIVWISRKIFIRNKKTSNMANVPGPLNYLLKTVTSMEHKTLNNKFFGLSTYAMFQKI